MGTATATASSNGVGNVTTMPPPSQVTVNINGAQVTAPAKPSKAGNIWFEAVQQGEIEGDKTIEQALLDAVVSFNGELLAPAKRNVDDNGQTVVALSEPQTYKKGHAKEGQKVPNTGGNPVISFVTMLPEWGEHGYMLRVTLTGIEKDAKRFIVVTVACQVKVAGRGKPARRVGHVAGNLGF